VILIRHGQTEFNRVYSATRRDPGIRDPCLTENGRRQALEVAQWLSSLDVRRLIASPYARALETADIIAVHSGLPIAVDALIAERCVFACDIGSPLAELRNRWPDLLFDHLPDPWWPLEEESEERLSQRSEIFRSRMAALSWSDFAVVTHWGFIRALTGLKVSNGTVLRFDPTRPDRAAELLFTPYGD
jgi:broad specificity phosphatase PhoE